MVYRDCVQMLKKNWIILKAIATCNENLENINSVFATKFAGPAD